MDIKPATLLAILWFLFSVFVPPLSSASNRSPLPGAIAQAPFSADDFDWREMVPYLLEAASLPGEQGIKAVLGNSKVLRIYVAGEVRAECGPDKNRCVAKTEGYIDEEVSKRIEAIVQEGIFRRHKTAIVDYQLSRRPFPFSDIAALKSEKGQDAYLLLELADHSYTAAQVQAKYGVPYDTDVVQWYSVYKYRVDSTRYTSKAVFEIDPVDGAVIKVAISLKTKKPKNRR
jgi:hypothetical protein